MNRDMLQRVLDARKELRAVALVTDLASSQQFLFPEDLDQLRSVSADSTSLLKGIEHAMLRDKSGTVQDEENQFFVHVHNPALKMIVVGAVHIAQALVPLAVIGGYEVLVVDPRRAFASDQRFPGVQVSTQWPDKALSEQSINHRTAIVTLTHDPKLDDPALQVALGSDAFYIGSLGSRRTHAARLERLQEAGFSADDCSRIHGPVGLDIGASTPAEIALSIMAQVTTELRSEAL